ncbi:18782_t:CDS:2, partial [Acaulospora morrowiae]
MSNLDSVDYEEKDNEIEVVVDDSKKMNTKINPHDGKSISEAVCSPNREYIATFSKEDKSIVRWEIKEGQSKLEPDHSINIGDDYDSRTLLGVSDKYILSEKNYKIKLIDLETGSEQKLYEGWSNETSFLENGDVVIVNKRTDNRVSIFSKSNSNNGRQYRYKSSIELTKFKKYAISRKGKLLILLDLPFVIMQWDLETLMFEAQYVLDLAFKEYYPSDPRNPRPESFNILTVISNRIIIVSGNRLQIKRWDDSFLKEYLEFSEDIGEYSSYFSGGEVYKIIKNISKKYEKYSNDSSDTDDSGDIDDPNGNCTYLGKLYSWTVEHSFDYLTLKARENEKEVGKIDVKKHKNGYFRHEKN